jgi:hypothetical protein
MIKKILPNGVLMQCYIGLNVTKRLKSQRFFIDMHPRNNIFTANIIYGGIIMTKEWENAEKSWNFGLGQAKIWIKENQLHYKIPGKQVNSIPLNSIIDIFYNSDITGILEIISQGTTIDRIRIPLTKKKLAKEFIDFIYQANGKPASTNSNAQKQMQWYNRSELVFLLCIFVFPVGLYGLWKGNYRKITKISTTLIVFFFTIIFMAIISTDTPRVTVDPSTILPGLEPVDIYLNMEKMGFVTEKISSEFGYSWFCRKNYAGIKYEVSFSSLDGRTVETVTATAMIEDVLNKNIIATKPFFLTISSLPFDGNEPRKVAEWINENFYNNKKSIIISGVEFTIIAPTNFVRMLRISKVQKQK